MKFSERFGHRAPRRELQVDGIDGPLRNSLWNVLDEHVWSVSGFTYRSARFGKPHIFPFSAVLWQDFFKLPMDKRSNTGSDILKTIRAFFFADATEWWAVYDFLEWTLNHQHNPSLVDAVNAVLERELSGFRFVGNAISPITDAQEVAALNAALADDDFPGVRAHLAAALQHLSDRKAPDYRNSIKESISAVESMAQVVAGAPGATLGDALAAIERSGKLHPALKKGFSSLYGYTGDADGIRHGMMDLPNLGAADAKFFLLSCTSFIGYLKSKL